MSQRLANLARKNPTVKTREELFALVEPKDYSDGRTKQCHADECDINKIMARFDVTGTISHVAKYEGVYADFSDFDFHKQLGMLTRGREIFDDLPAELRQEFGQSPAAFFDYVNDPANKDKLRDKLKGLASPGRQMPSADQEAAEAAASEPASGTTTPTPSSEVATSTAPPAPAEPAPAPAA